MLLTPVVYPARTEGLAGWLATWNPISPLITTARECLTAQPLTLLPAFGIVTVCAAIAAFLGSPCPTSSPVWEGRGATVAVSG